MYQHLTQETDSYHCCVEEGVDVEHGLQVQSVVQTFVLVTVPVTQTQYGHTHKRQQRRKTSFTREEIPAVKVSSE